MSRTPSMSVQEAESILGPRGDLSVTVDNRSTVRKWLTAQGIDSAKVFGASLAELEAAYNDLRGDGIAAILRKGMGNIGNNGAQQGQGNAAQGDGNGQVAQGQGDGENEGRFGNGNNGEQGENVGGDAAQQVAEIMRRELDKARKEGAAQAPKITPEELAKLIKEEIAKQVPRPIVIKNGEKLVEIKERTHPQFARILKLVAQGANVLLVGPAGCGKTHMAEQISRALSAEYGAIHGSAGASESALTGWLLPSEGGRFEYQPAQFVVLYEKGESLFLFDELDAFDPNMLLVANGALANGHIHIAHRREMPIVRRGKNARIMATANTYGTGGNPMYAGRSPLDAATLDRFVVVTVDYDEALERDIGTAGGLTESEMTELWAIRKRVREAQLRRTISTRAFQKAIIMKAAGDSWATIKKTLVEGWSRDEKAKAGV